MKIAKERPMTRRSLKGVGACLSLILMTGTPALAQTSGAQTDDGKTWRSYGQNPGATNFSPLTQITPDNVGQLKRAWTFRTRRATGVWITAGR